MPRTPPTRTQNADCGTWAHDASCVSFRGAAMPSHPPCALARPSSTESGEGAQCRGPLPRARNMMIAARGHTWLSFPRLPWARRWAAGVNLAVGADGPGEGVQCRGPPPRARKMPIAARGRTMHRASPSGGQQCRATPRALSRGPPRPSRERGPNAEGPSHARAKCRLRHVGMHDSPSPICHWRCASCSARLLYLQYQFQLHA